MKYPKDSGKTKRESEGGEHESLGEPGSRPLSPYTFKAPTQRYPLVPPTSPDRMALNTDRQPDTFARSFSVQANTGGAIAVQSQSYFIRKFLQGCAILLPIAVTVYATWWFLAFFDTFFSPLYFKLFGFHVFGLGFITSMVFIFLVGVFLSTWLGSLLLEGGEWAIMQLPIVKQIYSASKQVSAAVSPDDADGNAFKECVLVRHPRNASFAVAFVTGSSTLNMPDGTSKHLLACFVPTNHVYLGDVLLLSADDVIHTGMTVSEGMEVVVSLGMGVPSMLTGTNRKSNSGGARYPLPPR